MKNILCLIILFISTVTVSYACTDITCFKEMLKEYKSNPLQYKADSAPIENQLTDFIKGNKKQAFTVMMDELKVTKDSSKLFFYPVLFAKSFNYSEFWEQFQSYNDLDSLKKMIVVVIFTDYFVSSKLVRRRHDQLLDSLPDEAILELCKSINHYIFYYSKYHAVYEKTNLSSRALFVLDKMNFSTVLLDQQKTANWKDINPDNLVFSDLPDKARIEIVNRWLKIRDKEYFWDQKSYQFKRIVKPIIFTETERTAIAMRMDSIEKYRLSVSDEFIRNFKFEHRTVNSIEKLVKSLKPNLIKPMLKNNNNVVDTYLKNDRYNTIVSLVDYMAKYKDTLLMVNFSLIFPIRIGYDTLFALVETSKLSRFEKDLIQTLSFDNTLLNYDNKELNFAPLVLTSLTRLVGRTDLDLSKYMSMHEFKSISKTAIEDINHYLLQILDPSQDYDEYSRLYPNGKSKMYFYQNIISNIFFSLKWDYTNRYFIQKSK